jgi:hypothetical protein
MADLDPELIRLLEAVVAAREKERAANSNEVRAAAQTDALAAQDALDRATGIRDLRRRRMIAQARDLPLGAKVDADGFEQFARDCLDGTPSSQIRLRQAFARHIVDAAASLTPGWAGVLTSTRLQNAKGRYGPLDGPVRAGGVDPDMGAADELRNKIVVDAGYTVGVEIGGAGRIRHDLWKRAERAQNKWAAKLCMAGYKARGMSAATIKDLCLKEKRMTALFRDARNEGARQQPAPDRSRILPV